MAYTTEANVEAYLGETFDGTTTPTSTDITLFISWADKLINDFTGTAFESTGVTDEILDSEGLERFKLPKRPIISVTSFYVDKAGLGSSSSPDWEARTEGRTNSEDFVILKDEGVLYFHNDIPSTGIQNIKTTYNYGYSSVPADVAKLATLLVVREILRARLADNLYSSQDTISVGPITISKVGTQASVGVNELEKEINDCWKAVGKFKTVLH
tara:strand:- start:287 stop:925 length:639 start_codon:yes stop_codon:yes gene_type:complete